MTSFNDATAAVANSIRESSPIISLVVGVGALISAGVVACIATRKSEEILDEHKEKVDSIKKAKEEGKIDEKAASRQIGKTYLSTAGKVAIKMVPAVALAILGTTSIGYGYHVEHTRLLTAKDNLATMGTVLAGMTADFNAYRSRTRDRFGEEVDNEIMYDIHKEKIEEVVVNEKGKEKKVKREVTSIGDVGTPGFEMYSRWFKKDSSKAWVNDAEMNKLFIVTVQHKLNVKLCVEGVVTVNDIYKELGLNDQYERPMKSKAGQIMGYIWDPEGTDTQISLGLEEPVNQEFVNGNTPDFLICLRPEGQVWELLED